MLKAFDAKLRSVRFRCSVNLLLRFTGRVLTIAGITAVLAVLAQKLLAVTVITDWTLWSFWSFVAVAAILLWLMRLPSRMQASLLLDERLGLRERFSTTLAFTKSHDPFAVAACEEARKRAETVNIEKHFPIKPSRCWAYASSIWVLVLLIVFLMPQKDLLGFLKQKEQDQKQVKRVKQAIADVNDVTRSVRLAVKRLDPELAEALKNLDQAPKTGDPQDIKRQAIRKLGDLSEQIKKNHAAMQLDTMSAMQQMLKQLKGSSSIFSQKLRQALARGKFGEASNLMKQLQQQLADGKLSDQQRKDLAEQLAKLGKQLQELAEKNAQFEKELEKLGLDKKLAAMDPSQLKKALEKMGLEAPKIEELMKKLSACRGASSQCMGLGSAMAACGMGMGGLSGDEMAGVMDQLDALETMSQQLMLAQATLDELSRCMGCLGAGMGQGLGQGQGPWAAGQGGMMSLGSGGPGQGYGPRGMDESGQTSTDRTRVQNQSKPGPIIASWYFKGSQVKGEAQRDFSEVMQAARDSAAEAINQNEIPRKYEGAVKEYFSQLEESGPKQD